MNRNEAASAVTPSQTGSDPQFVFVAAAYGGCWTWDEVVRELSSRDVHAVTVELTSVGSDSASLGDLYSDAKAVAVALDDLPAPAILCGFSYGGQVISEAAAGPHPNVRRLVYLAGEIGDVGESVLMTMTAGAVSLDFSPVEGMPPFADPEMTDFFMRGGLVADSGMMAYRAEVMAEYLVAGGLPEARALELAARNRLMNPKATMQPLRCAAWKDIPSSYVLPIRDETGVPNHRRMAQRCTEVIEIPTGHFPMFTHPQLLADVLIDVAERA